MHDGDNASVTNLKKVASINLDTDTIDCVPCIFQSTKIVTSLHSLMSSLDSAEFILFLTKEQQYYKVFSINEKLKSKLRAVAKSSFCQQMALENMKKKSKPFIYNWH